MLQEADNERKKRDAEEMGDAMKSLENRTLDSKREMDILAALDETKSMKVGFTSLNVFLYLSASLLILDMYHFIWLAVHHWLIKF